MSTKLIVFDMAGTTVKSGYEIPLRHSALEALLHLPSYRPGGSSGTGISGRMLI